MQQLTRNIISWLLALVPIVATAQLKKTLSFDGPTGMTNYWQYYEYPTNNINAHQVTTDFFVDGTKGVKVTLNQTDNNSTVGNKRAEGLLGVYLPTQSGYDTTLRWWTWSWYFPSAGMPSDNREAVFAQWHDRAIPPLDCSTSPPFAIEIKNNRFRARIRYSLVNPYCSDLSKVKELAYDLGPVPLNKRLDIVCYYRPSADSNGVSQIYINDTLKFNYYGRNSFYGSAFPNFKLGAYKWLWNGSGAAQTAPPTYLWFYYDMVKVYGMNSTYFDVDQTPAVGNQPPNISAGPGVTITAPSTSTTLAGMSATDPEGTTMTYSWTQDEGPTTATIASASTLNPGTISGLTPGIYKMRLTVTDGGGLSSFSTTNIRVNLPPNIDLDANPSFNSLPNSTAFVDVVSTITDSDGTISSINWVQKTGSIAGIVIQSPTSANTRISGLTAGTRSFVVTATDNNGGISQGEVTITVNTVAVINISVKGYKQVTVNQP